MSVKFMAVNLPLLGIDIVDVSRLKTARFQDRLAEYILTKTELEEADSRPDFTQYLASRFAAKEAIIKASPETLSYHDIEIAKDGPRPCAKILKPNIGLNFSLSISHEFSHTVAVAMCSYDRA